ncbi:MAG: HAD-IC family P-type ATPase [Cyclobacteriaceae bacterium]|nr:HAD-IC family P-type ATPase [Cyclobacteriaceae bacterium]
MSQYFKQPVAELYDVFKTSPEGLSAAEADSRLKQHGLNVLPKSKQVTFLKIVLHQFASPLIYVLLAAGVVSLLIGEAEDAGFIFLIIIINAILGTYQEWKAETNAAALQQLVKTKARVIRDGNTVLLDAEYLVPGDVVLMESGMRVPADLRLISSNNLRTEEAILTGESLPVEKKTDVLEGVELPLGDQVNMLFAGTTVTSGRGRGLVVTTGLNTEVGKIAKSVTETAQEETPLMQRMNRFAKRISVIVLVSCTVIFLIGFYQDIPLIEMFFVAVAVAVSAIPEGLPIAMTVALSIGTSRMAKRNVIIRKLSAVEGLGSCNYIGTDKTGTLTVDQQTVKRIMLTNGAQVDVSGAGYNGNGELAGESITNTETATLLDELIVAGVLCNEAGLVKEGEEWEHHGDAIDVAFLALAIKSGKRLEDVRQCVEVIREIPFESDRKYAAIIYTDKEGKTKAAAKGALEAIVSLCAEDNRALFFEQANRLAEQGFRVLAVASGEVNPSSPLQNLSLLGLVALIDPLKPEAKSAVEFCHHAGIQVSMITGDHPSTALFIANELGIASSKEEVITGDQLGLSNGKDDEEFRKRLSGKTVFARVSPLQKQQIVEAVQHEGNFAAVTGDGVNDAPALKTANIGVAMGYGSDVAKESASIIVTDNNFSSIASGIEEGRYTYSNLRKIIYMLISTGAAEIIMVFMALITGLPLPFLPVQLLWLNLVTNGTQDVALAFEKGEPYVLNEPPRKPTQGIFDRLMITETLISASVMMLLTFGLWFHLLNNLHYGEAEARNIILLLMVLLQNFHVLNCRSERTSVFSMPLAHNHFVWLSIIVAQGIHILSMHIPFMQNLLNVEPVSLSEWLKLLATASIILVVMEVYKRVYTNRLKHSKVTTLVRL